MNEKDIQNLIDLAESKIREGVSKEEALDSLVGAGILSITKVTLLLITKRLATKSKFPHFLGTTPVPAF